MADPNDDIAMEMQGPILNIGALRPLLDMMHASGLDATSLLSLAGLRTDLFEQADTYNITVADYFRLCEQMALHGDDESCHISLRPLMAGTSKLVQARLMGCRCLSEMLEVVASSYNIIHGHRYNRIIRGRGTTIYEIDDTDFPYALGHNEPFVILSLEALLVYVHIVLLSAVGDRQALRLQRMTTRARPEAASIGHLDYWQVPVRRGADTYSLLYAGNPDDIMVSPENSPVLSARTIYGGVAEMLDRLSPPVVTENLSSRVKKMIAHKYCDQAEASRQLGMSVASLRRALDSEGTSFREIRSVILNRQAQTALRGGHSVQDVAEMLHFSDGRSFARAFHQWNGITPGAFAKDAGAKEDGVSENVPSKLT